MWLGFGILGLVVLSWRAYHNVTEPKCENQIFLDSSSPDRTKRAVVFGRSCTSVQPFTNHATRTGFCTQVSILPAYSALPNRDGNVFGIDCDHDGDLGTQEVNAPLRVRWLSDRELLIRHGAHVKVHHSETEVNGVTIRYKSSS